MRNITKIIVHASDSDVESHDDISVIRQWHLARGFNDVGYHYFITKKVHIQVGRPLSEVGAHTKGHNDDSIGICLSGKDFFTDEQFFQAKLLTIGLRFELGIGSNFVLPHNYFNDKKTCPNFDIERIENAKHT